MFIMNCHGDAGLISLREDTDFGKLDRSLPGPNFLAGTQTQDESYSKPFQHLLDWQWK